MNRDEDVKSVCLVNGSLRGERAASLQFLKDLSLRLPDTQFSKTFLTVKARLRDGYPEEMLRSMACADAIVLVFPLHNYGLPGALMRLLEDYYGYIKRGAAYNKDAKVYVIVNCAFPRPGASTGEAIRVVRNFCRRLSLKWRFAVCIGTGPVVVLTKRIPLLYLRLKRAYAEVASDICASDGEVKKDYLIRPVIPEAIIAMIKRHYERTGKMIEKENITKQA
ncbi:MAG: NAD(P)H-dependent oxidoreductase [Dehalococcoidia bacterium]|nr:NAD(P)H-dependent oxidoreductase [Dehalococcoidia bacterium]